MKNSILITLVVVFIVISFILGFFVNSLFFKDEGSTLDNVDEIQILKGTEEHLIGTWISGSEYGITFNSDGTLTSHLMTGTYIVTGDKLVMVINSRADTFTFYFIGNYDKSCGSDKRC